MPVYSIRQRSATYLFMWLAAGGAIRAHWTNEIHDEWMRNVARDYAVSRNVLERIRKLMNLSAGDALIDRYRQHEQLFPKTDIKDRHVAAAAVAARKRSGANTVTILTWNLKDFNRKELAAAEVMVETSRCFFVAFAKRIAGKCDCGVHANA